MTLPERMRAKRASATRLIYVGETAFGTTSEMRARALSELGFDVTPIRSCPAAVSSWLVDFAMRASYKLRHPIDVTGCNARLRHLKDEPHLIWIDKGVTIRPATLRLLRQKFPHTRIVGYSPDDMMQPASTSSYLMRGLPLYDAFITTKSFGVAELSRVGATKVIFCPNGYDPQTHRPLPASDPRVIRLQTDLSFIGTFEEDRAHFLQRLGESGLHVVVYGNGWEAFAARKPSNLEFRPAVIGDDYAAAISGSRINLCFLRRMCRDQQTTRSIEIPACQGFMLAERTDEHQQLFSEGHEAEYFSDFSEASRKIIHYLKNESERTAIAAAGRRRCIEGEYSYVERLREVLKQLGVPLPPPVVHA